MGRPYPDNQPAVAGSYPMPAADNRNQNANGNIYAATMYFARA
jgi:hypothetical protein